MCDKCDIGIECCKDCEEIWGCPHPCETINDCVEGRDKTE